MATLRKNYLAIVPFEDLCVSKCYLNIKKHLKIIRRKEVRRKRTQFFITVCLNQLVK